MDSIDTLNTQDEMLETLSDTKEDDEIEDLNDNYLTQNINIIHDEEPDIIEDAPDNIDDLISKIEEKSKELNKDERQEIKASNELDVPKEKPVENNKKIIENDFSLLDQYGENFSTKEYITNPAIGRDKEIGELIVILLTPEKSGILVGKPGIGKTAIVEGLGYRIKNGDVPDALKGYTIYKLNTASLTGIDPLTHELKIQKIVDNLMTLDKVMVFIDEIHTLIGNGENTLDFANILRESKGFVVIFLTL